jgi:KaiC/GvpD/RAD55 family RecA-like ATPase
VTWWPDADADSGSQKAFLAAAEKTDARDVRVVALPAGLPDGWDLADSIPDGIDPEALLAAAVPVDRGDRPAPRWQMSSLSEIESMPPVPWLIESVFRERGFILLYGESGAGKSWTALDMACCIATGSRWGGFNATQGKVLYVTLEDGKQGMAPRARAWIADRGIKVSDANFKLIDETVPLDNDKEVIAFVASVKAAAFDPDLVIFDTLALSTAGIDENAAKDAGAVVGNCKRIQRELNTAVMLIHHAKKDDARTYRGSTSWMAAVDTMISVVKSGDDAMTVECQKARSSAKFATTKWKLEPVHGVYWGDTPMVTTRYEKTEAAEAVIARKKALTNSQEIIRRAIETLTIQKQGGTKAEIITESGIPPSTVRDAINALQRFGWIFYDAERALYHTPRNHDTVTEIDGKKIRQIPSAFCPKTELTELTEIDGKKIRQPKPSHSLNNRTSDDRLTESDGKSSPLTENHGGIPPLGGPPIPSVRHFECGDLLISEAELL